MRREPSPSRQRTCRVVGEVLYHRYAGSLCAHDACCHLTPGITRLPAPLTEHEMIRVAGRVHAVVRRGVDGNIAHYFISASFSDTASDVGLRDSLLGLQSLRNTLAVSRWKLTPASLSEWP